MPDKSVRVLIAEDSPTVRYHLQKMINESPRMEVVGMATNGDEAITLAERLQPDIISMDVQMPVMDGLEATRLIMRQDPRPVVVVSGLVDREIDLSFRALQAGALAALPKPPAANSPDYETHRKRLWNTLYAMSEVQVVRRWASVYQVAKHTPHAYHTQRIRPKPDIITIASSAGGPSALVQLLGGLRQVSVPIVIVQHMPAEFLSGLARWLRKFTEMPVKMAMHHDVLADGVIYLAPGNAHLIIDKRHGRYTTHLESERGRYHYQPAADVLFLSVAKAAGERGVGVVLTGMGSDGAKGLMLMRKAGARTFAQDEQSCTVFGMPGAAIEHGAVERVLSPTQIAESLRKLV